MKSKLVIKSFSDFGLSTYEAKSYLSLLKKDSLSAVEVAKISGVPRGRVYEILDNLLDKGLCNSIPGKVNKYRAADPVVLREKIEPKIRVVESEINRRRQEIDSEIDRRKQKLNSEIEQKKQELNSIKKNTDEIIESLVPLYKESRGENNPFEYIEIIKDPYQIHKKFIELVGKVEKEMLAFDKPPYTVDKETRKEQDTQQDELLKAGKIRIKTIHEIPKTKEELHLKLKFIRETADLDCDENRVIAELPIKMAIFDEKVAIFELKDHVSIGESFTFQVVEHSALAKTLKITFETLWEKAEDYHILEDLLEKM